MTEAQLQIMIADYIRMQYPNVIFHSDYGSGIKLTARQAAVQKRQSGGLKGYPDMFIAEPVAPYCGLYIELKKDGTRLKKKNGEWASEHIETQADMLAKLSAKGYKAVFAVGFDEAMLAINNYLKG